MILNGPAASELLLRYSVEKESIERKLRGFKVSRQKRLRLSTRLECLEKKLIPEVILRIRNEKK